MIYCNKTHKHDLPEGNHTPLQRSAVCPPAPRAPAPAGGPLPGRKPPDVEPPWTPANTNIKHTRNPFNTTQANGSFKHVYIGRKLLLHPDL